MIFQRYLLPLVIAATMAVPGMADTQRDGATILDSGSTNTPGWKIEVWSDGSATIVPANRLGTTHGTPAAFTVPALVATKFFTDLQAARDAKVTGQTCMKSASFGTSTHVTWHDWNSPDLDCPADNALVTALVNDVAAIHAASKGSPAPKSS